MKKKSLLIAAGYFVIIILTVAAIIGVSTLFANISVFVNLIAK